MEILPEAPQAFRNLPDVHWTKEDGDWYYGPRIDACEVRGLADASVVPDMEYWKSKIAQGWRATSILSLIMHV